MKSILLIMPYGSVGGMERLAYTFYQFYKSQGFKVKAVKIIKLESDIIHFGDDEYFFSNRDFAEMPASERSKFYLRIPGMLRKILKDEKITHSISFGDMANIFSSLTFTREFKVASIHALKSVEFSKPSFLNKIFKLGFKTSYVAFDKVVCISKAIKEDLIVNCGFAFPKKLEVIYNPHNLEEIETLSAKPFDSQAEEELFSGKTIIFLGRLSIQKSPWHLVNAFGLLLKKEPETRLIFIGDGDENVIQYLNTLIQKTIPENKIHFLGRKANPYRYLKKAAVLALSSNYEGTPNVIVEAMALGVPVVSSNCTDGIMELMKINNIAVNGDMIETEAGIITPNFFNGELKIPEHDEISAEEKVFSDALALVLSQQRFRTSLLENRDILLEKFDFAKVSMNYLKSRK